MSSKVRFGNCSKCGFLHEMAWGSRCNYAKQARIEAVDAGSEEDWKEYVTEDKMKKPGNTGMVVDTSLFDEEGLPLNPGLPVIGAG